MGYTSLFKKAVTAVAAAAAIVTPLGYTALRYERGNNRYAACLAQNLGGVAGPVSVTDLAGNRVASFPVLRTYGLETLGLRPGVLAHGSPDTLALVLGKTGGEMKGHWDFARIGGHALPHGTYGRGDPVPTAAQLAVGRYAEICANNRWVVGAPG